MHREYLTGMRRRSKTNLEKRHRRVRQQSNKCLATVVRAMEIVLDETMPKESRVLNLYLQFDPATLREAMTVVRDLHELGDRGFLDELLARHPHLKRYFPAFLKLPFIAQPGAESLMQAIELARRLHAGEIEQLPPDAPIGFASGPWRAPLAAAGRDWRLWEIALAFAVSDALRSGDLYLNESRNHVSFWNLIQEAKQWEQTCAAAYAALNLPTDAAQTLDCLRDELDQAARELAAGLDGESRHALCCRLFFANQGDFLDGDYAEMMNKAASLALLSNAVLVWNTVRMTEIVNALEATAQPVDRAHLARVSPLAHKHVIPSGTYHFDRLTDGKRGLA